MDILPAEPAIHFLLNLIIQTHFLNAQCVILSTSNLNSTNIQMPIWFKSQFSVVVNPPHCIPGCFHYIIEDPKYQEPSWIDQCLLKNGDYRFKVIYLLETNNIKQYAQRACSVDAIFIYKENDSFTIAAFEDWEVTQAVILNRWCIKTRRFLSPIRSIEHFFHGVWKFYKNKPFFLNYDLVNPIYKKTGWGGNTYGGSDYHVLKEFATANNFIIDNSPPKMSLKLNSIFKVTDTGSYDNGSIYSYPMTGLEMSFLVPKPKFVYFYEI